jgi:hypothetical protein
MLKELGQIVDTIFELKTFHVRWLHIHTHTEEGMVRRGKGAGGTRIGRLQSSSHKRAGVRQCP